MGNISQ